jgi:hypothetical protein
MVYVNVMVRLFTVDYSGLIDIAYMSTLWYSLVLARLVLLGAAYGGNPFNRDVQDETPCIRLVVNYVTHHPTY